MHPNAPEVSNVRYFLKYWNGFYVKYENTVNYFQFQAFPIQNLPALFWYQKIFRKHHRTNYRKRRSVTKGGWTNYLECNECITLEWQNFEKKDEILTKRNFIDSLVLFHKTFSCQAKVKYYDIMAKKTTWKIMALILK